MDDSGKRKFIAVLQQGPVDSPEKAVQATTVNEHKNRFLGIKNPPGIPKRVFEMKIRAEPGACILLILMK